MCAQTLGDLPDRKSRIAAIDKMWNKVHYEGGVLVIIESGSIAGHEIVQEARSHLIDNMKNSFVVAPCGHNAPCGLFRKAEGPMANARRLEKPELDFFPRCSFPVRYERPHWAFTKGQDDGNQRTMVVESFNYIVVGKNVNQLPPALQAPRIIGSYIRLKTPFGNEVFRKSRSVWKSSRNHKRRHLRERKASSTRFKQSTRRRRDRPPS